jgi:hypothetical protein
MDSAKSFLNQNRGSIINIVYIIAALVAVYYIYIFLFAGSDLEATLLDQAMDANPSSPVVLRIPRTNPDLRVKQGGVYTISFWMYITSWDFRSGLAKSVIQISDAGMTSNDLLTTILYPNEAKMMVRVYTDSTGPEPDYTSVSQAAKLFSGGGNLGMFTPSGQMPVCDVQDIDLQRWINITISVNGRIVDIYYDGKLNRSCVLPGVPTASAAGTQAVVIGRNGGFMGKVSGVQFFGYPLTPDRVYAIYQIGPQSSTSFLGYIAEKLGITIKYAGYKGPREEKTIAF